MLLNQGLSVSECMLLKNHSRLILSGGSHVRIFTSAGWRLSAKWGHGRGRLTEELEGNMCSSLVTFVEKLPTAWAGWRSRRVSDLCSVPPLQTSQLHHNRRTAEEPFLKLFSWPGHRIDWQAQGRWLMALSSLCLSYECRIRVQAPYYTNFLTH